MLYKHVFPFLFCSGLKAAFALMGKPLEFSGPLPPLSLPPTLGSGHSMVNMGLSEDFLTTLFALLEQSGALNLDTAGQLVSRAGMATWRCVSLGTVISCVGTPCLSFPYVGPCPEVFTQA